MPTASAPSSDADWDRRAWLLIAGVIVFRAAYVWLFSAEFDLAGDIAYYWDWGRRLDWGYYSKPPMIGWLMGLAGRLSGNAEWAIRASALVLGSGSLVAMHRLARSVFDARTALLTLVLVICTPGNAALNLLFTIDSPLVLAWTLSLWFFWRGLQQPASWLHWCMLGVAVGFGSLSKQMMLVFPLLMLVHCAMSPADRAQLRNPRLWAAIAIGLLLLAPNLVWQQLNGWPTLHHMHEHFEVGNPADVEKPGLADHVGWFFQFPLTQALLYSPVTWVLVVALLIVALRHWKSQDRRTRFLVLFSGPALVAFLLLALRQEVHPNWPAVYYLSAFVLAGGWMGGAVTGMLTGEHWRAWSKRAIWVGAALTIITYALPLASRPLGWAGHRILDPFADLRGWKEAAHKAGEFLARVPRPDRTFIVVLGHRHNASEMAFYMPGQPRVYRWQWDGKIMSQYEIWPQPGVDKKGWDAFVIYPDSEEKGYKKLTLSFFFRRAFMGLAKGEPVFDKMGDIEVPVGHGKKRSFQVFLCKNMDLWPDPVPVQIARDPHLQELMEAKKASDNGDPAPGTESPQQP